MSAPSNTTWGTIQNSKGRIGIATSLSSTTTTTTVTIEVWLWTKWSITDKVNTLYFNNNATSATTVSKTNISVSHTVATGDGWSTENQTKLASYTYTYTRESSAKTYNCAAKFTTAEAIGSTLTATASYTIPSAIKFTVSYNSNGGSGSMADTTVTYGVSTNLRKNTFTRTGYSFIGWYAYRSSDSKWAYTNGSSSGWYTKGSQPSGYYFSTYGDGTSVSKTTTVDGDTIIMYAQWKLVTSQQIVQVRYQNADSTWGDYATVINNTYTIGDTVSWSREADTTYQAASISYTAPAIAMTKYISVYRQVYQINFNENGGKCAPLPQKFIYGCDLYLTTKRPTRSGYIFLGWSKSSTDTTATYTSGGSYDGTDTSSPTLYAIWSKRSQANIYLSKNGSYVAEYIEGETLSIGKDGRLYSNAFIEQDLTTGVFSIGNDNFISPKLCEGEL